MKERIQAAFGFREVQIKKLAGYDNANYLIRTDTDSYVFKTYRYTKELLALVEAETDVLLFLNESASGIFPKPIRFSDASFLRKTDLEGKTTICRMLSFLEGDFLGNSQATEQLYKSFGSFLATLDSQLATHHNPIIQQRQWEWDMQYLHLNKKYVQDIPLEQDRDLVNKVFRLYETHVQPILPSLRKQIIHNDANEWNVLVKDGLVSGMIDFGDLAYAPLINELAVGITYACYDKEEPLRWATIVLKAYHNTLPLEVLEIDILYYLIAARLTLSVCNSAHAKKINPANEHSLLSEQKAWKMLYGWLRIAPEVVEKKFRAAVGFHFGQ